MEMMYRPFHFNRARLCGSVYTAPELSHENHGRVFYRFMLSVPRLSGQCDVLPVIVPQQLLSCTPLRPGDRICVTGQLRSFNNKSGVGARLVISVLCRTLTPADSPACNVIRLCGTVCKPPALRRTPLGREICDMILAVNRHYGRADYLPCIAWGAVAQQTALLEVGDSFCLEGRIQSRTYTKTLPDGAEERTAYEVSVMRPATCEEFFTTGI